MKKFALLIAVNMGLVSLASAEIGPSFCSVLFIDIANQTSSDCVLLQKDLISGKLHGEKVLKKIAVGKKTNDWVTLNSDFAADLSLTYMCGNGMATVHIHKDSCISGGKASTYLSSIADMNATFKIYPSIYNYKIDFSRGNLTGYDLPGSVVWTFSEVKV
ncbi:MAG: hypothetical protein ACO1N3_03735 [Gammaproteobacteria bacterium]